VKSCTCAEIVAWAWAKNFDKNGTNHIKKLVVDIDDYILEILALII
jgi:hypothetical protein